MAESQILSTVQIISHLVCHKPMKWDSENQLVIIYIYIYIYMKIFTICILYIYVYCDDVQNYLFSRRLVFKQTFNFSQTTIRKPIHHRNSRRLFAIISHSNNTIKQHLDFFFIFRLAWQISFYRRLISGLMTDKSNFLMKIKIFYFFPTTFRYFWVLFPFSILFYLFVFCFLFKCCFGVMLYLSLCSQYFLPPLRSSIYIFWHSHFYHFVFLFLFLFLSCLSFSLPLFQEKKIFGHIRIINLLPSC